MWGPYTTEDQGRLITRLRDRAGPALPDPVPGGRGRSSTTSATTPPRPASGVGTMGDDGEKFGAWPTTWEHCWGEGRWVERFFEAIEANAGWLTTVDPSDWLAGNPPIGRVYIPTGSYAEMGEWALPPAESRAFSTALHHARRTERPRRAGCAARSGATSRSSTARSTTSTSRCSGLPTRSRRWPPGRERDSAMDHLYRGQSNDCYWHGLFGGIYIAHMRAATLQHLIAAEDLADAASGTSLGARCSTSTSTAATRSASPIAGQVVGIDLDEGAGIGVVGPPRRASRRGRGAATAARGLSRDAPGARAPTCEGGVAATTAEATAATTHRAPPARQPPRRPSTIVCRSRRPGSPGS